MSVVARRIAQEWKVGGPRGGIVLLVAPNQRQVRIETNDTVRVRLTDDDCARIIQQVLLPRFRKGDYTTGLAEGVEAIATKL